MTFIDVDPDVYQALVSSSEDHNTLLRHLLGAAGLMKSSTKKPYRKKKTGKWSLYLRGKVFIVDSVREGFRTAISKLDLRSRGCLRSLASTGHQWQDAVLFRASGKTYTRIALI
jgi:hypothetical protein